MPKKKQKKETIQNKSVYIYMALVTMTVVHFFAKPFKKGLGILSRRLRQASQRKTNLRTQLSLGQNHPSPIQFDPSPVPLKKTRRHHSK